MTAAVKDAAGAKRVGKQKRVSAKGKRDRRTGKSRKRVAKPQWIQDENEGRSEVRTNR